jgi:hypothetical protein
MGMEVEMEEMRMRKIMKKIMMSLKIRCLGLNFWQISLE